MGASRFPTFQVSCANLRFLSGEMTPQDTIGGCEPHLVNGSKKQLYMGLYGLSPWTVNHLLIGMHIQLRPYPYRDMMNIISLSTFGGPWKNVASFRNNRCCFFTSDVAVCRSKLGRTNDKWGFPEMGVPPVIHF